MIWSLVELARFRRVDALSVTVVAGIVLSVGARAVWPMEASSLRARLPEGVRDAIVEVRDWSAPEARVDAILHHGTREERLAVAQRAAQRPGPIVLVQAFEPGEQPLAVERLLDEEVPERAQWLRVIHLELNRVASHLFWIATGALDIGARA